MIIIKYIVIIREPRQVANASILTFTIQIRLIMVFMYLASNTNLRTLINMDAVRNT